jgi:cell division protein FtsI (penicillin-binding protein 3)
MRTRRQQPQIYVVGSLFALITLVLWSRLIYVQIISHSEYKSKARAQWTRTREVPAIRGGIFDRCGRPLALSTYSYSVYVDPTSVKNTQRVISKLSKIPGVSRETVQKKLKSKSTFEWVKRRCPLTEALKDTLQTLRGVGIHIVADRVYPWEQVANKLIGFVGHDNRGMAGIEAAYNETLSGKAGWEKIVLDGEYKAHGYYNFPQKLPENGKQIILTIDAVVQEIAESELECAVKKTKARWGSVIILDNKTGEILALAEYPTARTRTITNGQESLWTIQSLSCVFEPGSTFKIITSAALLEMGLVSPSETFNAENGRADLGFAVISDAHPNGILTFREGFVESSNIVMAKAAMRMSRIEFYKFIRLFGFGVGTGVELLGESGGSVTPVDDWSERTQATMSFGQEISVTPLQMAR